MKKILFAVLLVLIIFAGAYAQTEKEKINLALSDYIEGFYEGDTAKIIRSISPAVVKYGYFKEGFSSRYTGEPMSYREMIDYAKQVAITRKTKPLSKDIMRRTEIFDVMDQTASGKITAWWGTDYILLEKHAGKWMIRMVLWQGPLQVADPAG